MGFRELLYFRVFGCLGEQGVWLTREQKREIYTVFERHRATPKSLWLLQEGKLVLRGAVPLGVDLTSVSRDLRCSYRLFQRPLRAFHAAATARQRYQVLAGRSQ